VTRDEIEELERALREAEPPEATRARERARRTVLAAHAQAPPRRTSRLRLAAVAVTTLLAALAFTQRDSGPARAFKDLVRDVVAAPQPTPAPTPADGLALPAAGRLLVNEDHTLWVVERSGKRRRLGAGRDASWSPHGLFVAAASGRTLAAIDPDDRTIRWRLRPGAPVSLPRWAPDGLQVAYRSGRTLRIVYGNGKHDVRAGRDMAAVAPAWRPGRPRTLAWAATDGTVTLEDALTAKVLKTWRAGPVRRLAWSADGRRLLVGGRRDYTIHDLATNDRDATRLPRGAVLAAAAFAPGGNRLALAVDTGEQTEIRLQGRALLTAPGRLRGLEWSPDGRWLLTHWAGADHWLLVRTSTRARASSVSAVRHRFGATTATHGWCC
jgi:hypothetical protein